jgi:hypothetical protein
VTLSCKGKVGGETGRAEFEASVAPVLIRMRGKRMTRIRKTELRIDNFEVKRCMALNSFSVLERVRMVSNFIEKGRV